MSQSQPSVIFTGKPYPYAMIDETSLHPRECPRCLFTSDVVSIKSGEECEMCKIHNSLVASAISFAPILNNIKRAGRKKKYDCLIGISGGVDSSTLLYSAIRKWNLRPLVIHFNNFGNVREAELNMHSLITKLGVDARSYSINTHEYEAICRAMLRSGVPDIDIPNDLAMTELSMRCAYENGIKYVLNGHDFRTEGSSPRKWSQIDQKYMNDVYEKNKLPEDPPLHNYPQYTFLKQLKYAFAGIKQVRPFHYKDVMRKELEAEMKAVIKFKDYGGIKHGENIRTKWVSYHVLVHRHLINKTITYLSAQIRSGEITKAQAKEKLAEKTEHDWSMIPWETKMLGLSKVSSRDQYARYNFRKYKLLMWVLMKMNLIAKTFYVKYCS